MSQAEFEQLFLSNYQSLFALGFKLSMDKALTKDMIQTLFLELWEKREQMREIEHWNAYLRKSLHRKMVKELKGRSLRSADLSERDAKLSSPSYEELLINFQSAANRRADLRTAIDRLPIEERKVLRLRFYDGMSYEEIADQMNKSKRTVYNQIFAAIRKLRKSLLLLILA